MIDVNQHIYKGRFSKALAEQDIHMEGVFYQVNGIHTPNSHLIEPIPICGVFVFSGIDCTGVFIHCHHFGLSNHRMHGIDITIESIF